MLPPPLPPPKKKKKKLAQFSYPKKSQNQKVQTPKNPLIIPVASNLVYPLPPTGLRHLCSIFTETGPKSPFSCVSRALSKTAFHFLCQRKSYLVLYCRHSWIQGEILPYNNVVEHILAELVICKMATFYYYDQNPFWFSFHIQFGNPNGVWITKALICTRMQTPEGFWL